MSSMLRVVYIPRQDAKKVTGGDIILFRQLKKHIHSLGVDIDFVPIEELGDHSGGDCLHLSQIYQLDTAETAIKWAQKKSMPIFISPLFEDNLSLYYRQAVASQRKWQIVRKMAGFKFGQRIYNRWQLARNPSTQNWQRQRALLLRSHIITNTYYEFDHVTSFFKIGNRSASIVRVGIDTDLFGSWSPNGGNDLPQEIEGLAGQYVLQVSLISRRKNQAGLIEALHETNIPIVFLGRSSPYETSYYEHVKNLARNRGNVFFLEWVNDETLLSLYGNALVHILPSWSERPGMVSLEAAACGSRVISSNRAPIHEYLENRAWYVDPSDSAEILSTIRLAATFEPPEGLREHVLSNFGWKISASQLKHVYLNVLS